MRFRQEVQALPRQIRVSGRAGFLTKRLEWPGSSRPLSFGGCLQDASLFKACGVQARAVVIDTSGQLVMAGLSRPSTSWITHGVEDVDTRDKRGHDGSMVDDDRLTTVIPGRTQQRCGRARNLFPDSLPIIARFRVCAPKRTAGNDGPFGLLPCSAVPHRSASLRGAKRRSNPVSVRHLDCFATLAM